MRAKASYGGTLTAINKHYILDVLPVSALILPFEREEFKESFVVAIIDPALDVEFAVASGVDNVDDVDDDDEVTVDPDPDACSLNCC